MDIKELEKQLTSIGAEITEAKNSIYRAVSKYQKLRTWIQEEEIRRMRNNLENL